MISNKQQQKSGLAIAMIGSKGLSICHSGLEAHVRALAGQLGLLGNRVTVYGCRNHGYDLMSRECVPRTGVEDRQGFWLKGKLTTTVSNSVWATIDAIRSGRFDVLHYHGVGCVFGLLLARRMGTPTVLSLHSTNWQEKKWSRTSKQLIHRFERTAIGNADSIIAVSEALASRVKEEYDVSAHIIPNGVGSMEDPSQDDEILHFLGLETGRYLLFVGRLVPDKGCHVLVEAFKRANIPLKLILVGPHQDSSYAASLLGAVRSSICAPGSLNQMELCSLYRCCWAFCSASFVEGQSRVVIEALAHGARCIVSDIPGHRELVTNPNMRFPANDIESLRDKLLELYSRKKTGSDCKRSTWLEEHPEYMVENTARRVLDVYARLRLTGGVNRVTVRQSDYADELSHGELRTPAASGASTCKVMSSESRDSQEKG